jgi:hypothetical protein
MSSKMVHKYGFHVGARPTIEIDLLQSMQDYDKLASTIGRADNSAEARRFVRRR